MLKVFLKLFFLISLLSSTEGVFALVTPFTDIRSSDPYFEAVWELYENRVISDNGDHLFRPNDLMNRDFFVSLAVGIGCHECETPSVEDIIKYQVSPFIDLPKTNRYYYCTAYAKDIDIIRWYIPDTTGQATCEDQKKYMSSPFCSENTISRIEAAAILLRRAKLWDDTMNSGFFDKSITISDTTTYWYGYAKKWIEIGIIKQDGSGKIGQDEKITRGEFAIMAARILRYTQCQVVWSTNSAPAAIWVKDASGNIVQKSGFASGEVFTLVPITPSGNWDFGWKATNMSNGNTLSGSGNSFPGSKFGNNGNWFVTLDVIDPATKKVVAEPTTTISVWGDGVSKIWVKDASGNIVQKSGFASGEVFTLVPITPSGNWDFGWKATNMSNGNTLSGSGNSFPGSKFGNNGNWFVTLDVIDPATKKVVAEPTTTISVWGDTSGLEPCILISSDPLVAASGFNFDFIASPCGQNSNPKYTWDYGDGTSSSILGNTKHSYVDPGTYTVSLTVVDQNSGKTWQSTIIIQVTGEKDSDGDGITDSNDQCPLVYAKTINGCPNIATQNSDNNTDTDADTSWNWNWDSKSKIEANIGVQDSNLKSVNKNTFSLWEEFFLIPITWLGNWEYSWQAINIISGKITTGTGNQFKWSLLGTWTSLVTLNVIDPITKDIVASPGITIAIGASNDTTIGNIPCVSLEASPMRLQKNSPTTLTSTTCNKNNDPLTYKWDFWDGTTSTANWWTDHKYTQPGIYTITLLITNEKTGKTGKAKVLISVGSSSQLWNSSSWNGNKTWNVCIDTYRKAQWLITGSPNCTQCPCNNSIVIDSPLRACDIVFPTILSPELDTVYSRWWFYLIP